MQNPPSNGLIGLLLIIPLACQDPDPFPTGPCNEDGDTFGANDEVGEEDPNTNPPRLGVKPGPTPINDVRRSLPSIEGWERAPALDGFYRHATPEENRRFGWSDHTLIVATPFDFSAEESSEQVSTVLPSWSGEREQWFLEDDDQVQFRRHQLTRIQTLSLGHFVEHRTALDGSKQPSIYRPEFEIFGAHDPTTGFRMRLVSATTGGLLLRGMGPDGGMMVSSPHTTKSLDIAAPPGFQVTIVSPSMQDIARDPLTPYDCKNGPTDAELLQPKDRGVLYFDEVTERAWQDLELNTLALDHYGEPVNGVVFLSSDAIQTCLEYQLCAPAAGLAYISPGPGIRDLGFAVVTDLNSYDWRTLAHEVGHVLGLEHDFVHEGFMNDTVTGGLLPLIGIAQDDPNFDNNEAWDKSLNDKGWLPRSSGWSHTGCSGFDECAPLGKPGWSCNALWCVQD